MTYSKSERDSTYEVVKVEEPEEHIVLKPAPFILSRGHYGPNSSFYQEALATISRSSVSIFLDVNYGIIVTVKGEETLRGVTIEKLKEILEGMEKRDQVDITFGRGYITQKMRTHEENKKVVPYLKSIGFKTIIFLADSEQPGLGVYEVIRAEE